MVLLDKNNEQKIKIYVTSLMLMTAEADGIIDPSEIKIINEIIASLIEVDPKVSNVTKVKEAATVAAKGILRVGAGILAGQTGSNVVSEVLESSNSIRDLRLQLTKLVDEIRVSGNQRVGADGIHTLPLGFWKNIGKDKTKLPHNSRSQLAYMVTEGDLAGKYVFGFGPPTEDMAVDSPQMWQLSSKSIIPDVPNTWDVRGQTMWDQMGEYPWAAYNQPSLQSKGVNFMA